MASKRDCSRTRFAQAHSLAAALVVASSGCECGAGPAPPARHRAERASTAESSAGAERTAAVAYRVDERLPPADAFEPLRAEAAQQALRSATRAGSWAALRRGGEERRSAGNFVCRLEALFGPPGVVEEDRLAFVLRDRETGLVLGAIADLHDAWFVAVLAGEPGQPDSLAQTTAARVVLGLAALVDATTPISCEHRIAGRSVGVRSGVWY